MGSIGDCYDNALCESFFATLECEWLDRYTFKTQAEARMFVFDFIEGFYNPRRRHSALGLSLTDQLRKEDGSDYRRSQPMLSGSGALPRTPRGAYGPLDPLYVPKP